MSDTNPVWKVTKPFLTGSLSGSIATCCIQPMDMIKVRIQVAAAEGKPTNPITIGAQIVKTDGPMALYSGLSAGLTRQVIYTGARLGLYDTFTDMVKTPGQAMPLYKTAGCALAAGGLAAVVGNPADLALIRMQTDSMLPKEQRAGYRHAGHAMSSILKNEGAVGLLKGAAPTSFVLWDSTWECWEVTPLRKTSSPPHAVWIRKATLVSLVHQLSLDFSHLRSPCHLTS